LVPWLGGADDGGRTTVINLDGVGEPGPVGIAGPTPLVRWLKESARRAGVDVRRVRFPPGSATDAVPLRRAGFPVVGLTSGRLGPGARAVHTPGDRPEHVSPDTLERVVRLLEAAARGEEARR
jgi:putative aminopeptidase FrvX